MSRIGKLPVAAPAGVSFTLADGRFSVKGPKGELDMTLSDQVVVSVEGNQATVRPRDMQDRSCLAMWGTARAHIANMAHGVSTGFEKTLELVGIGYRAQMRGKAIELNLGYSHPVVYQPREGIGIATPSPTRITVSGANRQAVGQCAAEIRRMRPPEPYKGKGVRYAGELVRRKEGKKK